MQQTRDSHLSLTSVQLRRQCLRLRHRSDATSHERSSNPQTSGHEANDLTTDIMEDPSNHLVGIYETKLEDNILLKIKQISGMIFHLFW